jgi:hypothetical protein
LIPLIRHQIEIFGARAHILSRYIAKRNRIIGNTDNMSQNKIPLIIWKHCSLASSRGKPPIEQNLDYK